MQLLRLCVHRLLLANMALSGLLIPPLLSLLDDYKDTGRDTQIGSESELRLNSIYL